MKAHPPLLTAIALAALAGSSPTSARADVVHDWNVIMQATVSSSNPLVLARAAAIVQLAVFEAVNAIEKDYQPYVGLIDAPSGASPEAAAVAAAHGALVALYPASAVSLDASLAASLAAIPDGPAKDAGIAVGETAAKILLALRANDGSSDAVPYTPGTDPGDWQPTPPAFAAAFSPHWGSVDTFGIRRGAQFRLGPPPPLRSFRFACAYNEVKALGAVDSAERPQDRADVARFYAVVTNFVALYHAAARQVSAAQGRTLSENARDFALLGIAGSDSFVACFDTKYTYNFWRPVAAIRAGDTDGNPRTSADPDWLPLITTPAHPSYPSAHASAAGAARAVLEHLYGEDGHDITLTTPSLPDIVLHYTAWEQITDDIDDARIYGGIHYRFDQEAGARQGRQVGRYVLLHELRPVRHDHRNGLD